MANEVTITVSGRDQTGSVFAKIRQGIKTTMDRARADVDQSGRGIGTALMSSVATSIKDGASKAKDAMAGVFTGALKGASSTPIVGPVIIAAMAGIAAVAAPALAAALSGAMVLGLGAGFVGVGAMLLMENKKVKASFDATFKEIKGTLTDAFKPLIPVLNTVQGVMKGLAKEFAPVIKSSMELAKGPLKEFVKSLGRAFSELKPTIKPMMDAFTSLLGVIGPQLPGLFESIAGSLTELFKTVMENKDVIAGVFIALMMAIPPVIDAVGWLTRAFGEIVDASVNVASAVMIAFQDVKIATANMVEGVARGARSLGEVLSHIPGMEDFGRAIMEGADGVIRKMGEIRSEAERTKVEIQIKADIWDLQEKLNMARTELKDPNLTKERRATLNADISKLMANHADAIRRLGDPKLIKTYTANLNADKSKLEAALAAARKGLADPNLTKERKAKLNADIAQLKSQIAAAKGAIASVRGKTVAITVNTIYNGSASSRAAIAAKNRAHGGVVGGGIGAFANGGVSGASGATALVGEQGPELVRLPFGSTVVPAGGTRALLDSGGGSGLTVNIYVQGSIRSDRDLVNIIRDEFVNGGFRGALNNT